MPLLACPAVWLWANLNYENKQTLRHTPSGDRTTYSYTPDGLRETEED